MFIFKYFLINFKIIIILKLVFNSKKNLIEERREFLYIMKCKLQVQEEVLYRLGYTTLGKYKLQL